MSFRVFDHYCNIIDILFKYTNLCKTAKESRRSQYLFNSIFKRFEPGMHEK